MADDTTDSVKEKFAARFEGEEQDAENAKNEQTEKTSEKAESSETGSTSNIKNAWTNHSVYLPDELAQALGREYKQLDLDLDREHNLSIKKTRHYYPLIVSLGLERLEELETEEIKERVKDLD